MNKFKYTKNLKEFNPFLEKQAENNANGIIPSVPFFNNHLQSFCQQNTFLDFNKTYKILQNSTPNIGIWFQSIVLESGTMILSNK